MFKSTNSEIKVFKKDDFEHNKSKVFLFIKNLKKIYVCVLYEILNLLKNANDEFTSYSQS